MSLDEFLHNLHFDTDKARPVEWETDWEDAPLAYKLYRHLPVVPLPSEVSLTLHTQEAALQPDLLGISQLLWYTYGLTQICQSAAAFGDKEQPAGLLQSNRRFVPSGGALYPSEIYVYVKMKELPAGVYHYDAAHHRLVLLREGNYDSYLSQALGGRCGVQACFGFVFVSAMFWKNFFKYNNFAYRLQGLDAGVLIGQLLEVTKRCGYKSGVHFQFLDRAVNHLLGLSEREESVYAVIPLSTEPAAHWFETGKSEAEVVSAVELCRELPAVNHAYYIRSQRVAAFPMLIKMNEAAMLESVPSLRARAGENDDKALCTAVALPCVQRLSYDLAAACKERYSPEHDFVLRQVSLSQLADLLHETMASFTYRNDLDGANHKTAPRVSLYVCLHGVQDIPDGAYRYDAAAHELQLMLAGDQRRRLQMGMSLDNVNLHQVPFCIHVAGDIDHLKQTLGYRGYRIQQMEAGMLVQRLLLAASALGLGGRPLLGYDVKWCDEIYKMDRLGKTCLIQIPVGPYRCSSRLEGGLHS
ncbi:SagB family peptide dehydrogenase [Paenibacillus abyssi]|uniref:NADH oxidase n=1 Tax=Paenibacillus abyssi TaxID=1340531 RepID=A0A917CZ83_9BACL|nr:SagB family peptide dehydrogenase [Paenibacillus abyssi]GGG03289.1 NADH oxidase [Paenibacillus abyssi]